MRATALSPLGRFLEDGRLPVDNGEVERLIKLIVLGRKNWLFLGSDTASHRAASVYSLVLSCYRVGMDPWAYFRDVLPKLGDTHFHASRLAELLPEFVGPAAGSAAIGSSTRRPSRSHRATLRGGRHHGLDRRLT